MVARTCWTISVGLWGRVRALNRRAGSCEGGGVPLPTWGRTRAREAPKATLGGGSSQRSPRGSRARRPEKPKRQQSEADPLPRGAEKSVESILPSQGAEKSVESLLPSQGAVATVEQLRRSSPQTTAADIGKDRRNPEEQKQKEQHARVDTTSGAEPAACRTASSVWKVAQEHLGKSLSTLTHLPHSPPLLRR